MALIFPQDQFQHILRVLNTNVDGRHKVPFPLTFMPSWFVNRKKDIKDGKTSHVYANLLDTKMRESLERLWKCRAHRGLRHGWGVRVRGQKTCTTGRHGKTVGVARKKGQ